MCVWLLEIFRAGFFEPCSHSLSFFFCYFTASWFSSTVCCVFAIHLSFLLIQVFVCSFLLAGLLARARAITRNPLRMHMIIVTGNFCLPPHFHIYLTLHIHCVCCDCVCALMNFFPFLLRVCFLSHCYTSAVAVVAVVAAVAQHNLFVDFIFLL